MTILNICGWERGTDALERNGASGTPVYQTSVKRTGGYALQINPADSVAMAERISTVAATGENANMGRTAETFYTFHFRFEDLPAGTVMFASISTSGGTNVCSVNCSSGGEITITGVDTSATIATIVADTWYRLDWRATSNGTCAASIDGGAEQTCTGANQTQDRINVGRHSAGANAYNCYYDDLIISDSGFPGAGDVRQSLPIGAGNYSGWTNGTNSDDFNEVDDAPHDTDTTYISASATEDDQDHTFAMQTAATIGLAGTIVAVKTCGVCRADSTSGVSGVGVKLRSGTTDSETTEREWSTTYALYAKILDVDPNGGIAWTLSGFDGIECGVFANTIAQAQRCTAVSAMVWQTYTATITGTATASIDEADIIAGGKTIVITLAGTTWVASGAAFDAVRQAIINGLNSAQSEGTGWNAEVRDNEVVGAVVRTSDTVVTITLSAAAAYDITAQETITVTVPHAALVGGGPITASPTFTVDTAGGGTTNRRRRLICGAAA